MDTFLLILIIGAPLLASGLTAALGPRLGERSSLIGIFALSLSTVAALMILFDLAQNKTGTFTISVPLPEPLMYTVLIDRLAAVMMALITSVSLVIHVYSQRYMQGDQGYVRFFSLLGLLTFVLLSLVTSGSIFWLFVWWHLITWLLVLLVSFNHASPAARAAGRTTLRVQGLGDASLLAGILLIYTKFGTFDLAGLFEALESSSKPVFWAGTVFEVNAISAITLVILLAIVTKSAQFPFHVWLPGTIEAPTPVSAILHAGIVNAGGFLVNRLAPLYGLAPTSLYLMFFIGGLTALIGATTMLTQPSVKRRLVYSTMGQMGYMIMECGLGAFALAVFHLCAHGLFKATLFLNSGANIQKARSEFKLPDDLHAREAASFSPMTWATGLVVTLIVPLLILLVAHGIVNIALFEAQGTVIFLLFAWVTSAQAIFSLYRLHAVASWKVSMTMVVTVALIGLTYLWAGETFTLFLYAEPGQASAYFQVAGWPKSLFDAFVSFAVALVIVMWSYLYGKAHGMRFFSSSNWFGGLQSRAYVAFLNGLYIEDVLRAWGSRARQR